MLLAFPLHSSTDGVQQLGVCGAASQFITERNLLWIEQADLCSCNQPLFGVRATVWQKKEVVL